MIGEYRTILECLYRDYTDALRKYEVPAWTVRLALPGPMTTIGNYLRVTTIAVTGELLGWPAPLPFWTRRQGRLRFVRSPAFIDTGAILYRFHGVYGEEVVDLMRGAYCLKDHLTGHTDQNFCGIGPFQARLNECVTELAAGRHPFD